MSHVARVYTRADVWVPLTMQSAVKYSQSFQSSRSPDNSRRWLARQRPSDLATRDLYYGPWGSRSAPDPDAVYTFVERKHSGVNPGMDVIDPQGREWSVKQAYQPLVRDRITPDDVAWAADLLARLSEQQWRDAFRAGGYEPQVANRFIRKLREKIRQGQELTRQAAAR